MKRPSARFNGRGHRRDDRAAVALGAAMSRAACRVAQRCPGSPVSGETPLERAVARELTRRTTLALIRQRGELYSAELAAVLGCQCSSAKSVLRSLEAQGLLESEHRPHWRSGHGRRYYWLRELAAMAGGSR